MRAFLTASCLMAFAAPATADMRLSDLVGNWSGEGTYAEGVSVATMRCRVAFAGNELQLSANGRCGSSLGSQQIVMILSLAADGSVSAQAGPGAPPTDSKVEGLRGALTATQLLLRGTAEDETVTMLFRMEPGGVLKFATERTWQTGNGRSVVNMTRR